MKTILFACVHNAGRSQMAAAYFNALANPLKARGISAGTQPVDRVHAEVIQVMDEIEIDVSRQQPQLLTDELARTAQFLITMGCGDACPFVPGLKKEDWRLEDPKGQPLERVRQIRDEIHRRVQKLIEQNGWE